MAELVLDKKVMKALEPNIVRIIPKEQYTEEDKKYSDMAGGCDLFEDEYGLIEQLVPITYDPYKKWLCTQPVRHYGNLFKKWAMGKANIIDQDDLFFLLAVEYRTREVDYLADKEIERLEEIYDKTHTRPDGSDFRELVRWEREKKDYINNRILQDIVYVDPEIILDFEEEAKIVEQRANSKEYEWFYNNEELDNFYPKTFNYDGDLYVLEQRMLLQEKAKRGISEYDSLDELPF